MAIFVEGFTELLFVDRLIREIAEMNQVAIEKKQIRGGGRRGTQRHYVEISTPTPTGDHTTYVLIVDCGGDRLVAQRVREEHQALTNSGYELIVGLRDVFPDFERADIPKLRSAMRYGVRTKLAPVSFLLSVMEIEAWFLAEHSHFPKIDPAITVDAIRANLGFNPATDDMTERASPTNDLNNAYQIGGKTYLKGDGSGTIDCLDYENLYITLRQKIPDLSELLTVIENYLS